MFKQECGKNVLVQISVLAYNQRNYIEQNLNSILSQKTNFEFEILINDDCSTDGTTDIIKKYEHKYPQIIKAIYHDENCYSKGIDNFITFIVPKANSKYLAICDGDDYWTDPYKLQKQVDFLESNQDYSTCFTRMKMISEYDKTVGKILPLKMGKNPQSFIRLLKGGYIPAQTVMYRRTALQKAFDNYPIDIYPPDWFFEIMAGKEGKIGFLKDITAVYRRNEGGMSYTKGNHAIELHKKYGIKEMNFFYEVWQQVKDIYPEYYSEMFLPNLRDIYFTYLQMGDFAKLDILKEKYSDYFKDMESSTGIATKKHKKYKKMFTVSLIINIVLAVFLLGLSVLCFLKII